MQGTASSSLNSTRGKEGRNGAKLCPVLRFKNVAAKHFGHFEERLLQDQASGHAGRRTPTSTDNRQQSRKCSVPTALSVEGVSERASTPPEGAHASPPLPT
ncbi:unnamed protein product, partial [Ixodes pacificus]